MNNYELLLYCAESADTELEKYISNINKQDNFSVVFSSLFKKIIEYCAGVVVSSDNNLLGASILNYRAALEVYASLNYIVEKNDNETKNYRAAAYTIGYHKQKIANMELLLKNRVDEEKPEEKKKWENLQQLIKWHEKQVKKVEFSHVLKDYEHAKKQLNYNKKGQKKNNFLPKWYSLDNGPNTFNKLVKLIKTKENSEVGNIFADMYSLHSIDAHSYLALDEVEIKKDGEKIIKSLQNSNNDFRINTLLMDARVLLTSSLLKFKQEVYSEYDENSYKFLETILPYLEENS